MKYCPYCGAALLGSAISFCAACGKALPEADVWAQPEGLSTSSDQKIRRGFFMSNQKKAQKKPPKKKTKQFRSKNPYPPEEPVVDPADDGYDGYYDDVLPTDKGYEREGLDPELIKRIVMVGVGALLIVGLSIAAMYFL